MIKKNYLLIVLGIVALILISCQNKSEVDRADLNYPVVDSVKSEDGLWIRYQTQGTGDQTLVFVHCWSGDRSYWDMQVPEFSTDYRVVTLDLAGHGDSETGREIWSMSAFGADVTAVIDKLKLQNVILVGHSMGGAVIVEAARKSPGKIKALVGVDNLQKLDEKFTEEQIEQFLVGFREDFVSTTSDFVRGMFPPDTDSNLVEKIVFDIASAPEEIALGAFKEFFLYDFEVALQEVHLPIRCINSDKYKTEIEINKAIAESFEVKIMPGRGHFLQQEDPPTFNKLLHETIAEFWPVKTK